MKLEESGFAGVFDLNNPEWKTEDYKAFTIEGGVVLLPVSDEFPVMPTRLGSIFYGAYLIADTLVNKDKCDSYIIELNSKSLQPGFYPYITIKTYRDRS